MLAALRLGESYLYADVLAALRLGESYLYADVLAARKPDVAAADRLQRALIEGIVP